jgi:hypothetical protein
MMTQKPAVANFYAVFRVGITGMTGNAGKGTATGRWELTAGCAEGDERMDGMVPDPG